MMDQGQSKMIKLPGNKKALKFFCDEEIIFANGYIFPSKIAYQSWIILPGRKNAPKPPVERKRSVSRIPSVSKVARNN